METEKLMVLFNTIKMTQEQKQEILQAVSDLMDASFRNGQLSTLPQ